MKFTILTLFPEMIKTTLAESILGRAQKSDAIQVETINIRDYSKDKHKRVDDEPYGGGAGMLMACQPLFDCIEDAKKKAKRKHIVVYLSPRGKRFTQTQAERFAKKYEEVILVCGHYEGIDQRVIDALIDAEISIGDYVLTGGELPACVIVDAVARLVPDVLGKEESHIEESFSKALGRKKEYPHYTRPAEFKGLKVPEILLSGDHKKIEKWRREQCK